MFLSGIKRPLSERNLTEVKVCFPGLFLDASDTSERLQQDSQSVSGVDGRLATEPLSVLLFFLCGNVKPGPEGETRQPDPLKQTSDCWFQDASSAGRFFPQNTEPFGAVASKCETGNKKVCSFYWS